MKFPEAPSGAALNALMSPAAFQLSNSTPTKTTEETNPDPNIVLTKEQFQEALLRVLQVSFLFVTNDLKLLKQTPLQLDFIKTSYFLTENINFLSFKSFVICVYFFLYV